MERVRFHAGRSHTGIAIDKAVLVRQLSELLDAPVTRRLEFSKLFARDSLAFTRLSTISTLLWTSLRDDPETVASTKYAELLFQTIVAVMLDVIPHNYSADLRGRRASAMPWHIKRAIEYMVSNVAQPLTIGEIARETGVSVRNLQVGFSNSREQRRFNTFAKFDSTAFAKIWSMISIKVQYLSWRGSGASITWGALPLYTMKLLASSLPKPHDQGETGRRPRIEIYREAKC